MSGIALKSQNIHQHTLVNNLFIDHYMPQANGDYVKVYLYILRLVVSGSQDFTIEKVAKQLNLIQSDVLRALTYWAQQKLIEVTFEEDEIVAIGFLSLEKTQDILTKPEPVTTLKPSSTHNNTEVKAEPASEPKKKKQARLERKPQYSMEEMAIYAEQSDFKELLYITERYMQKPLSQADVNMLLGFIDWLGLPIEVVEYLIEHCVTDGHRHMNYIEKVAMDWSEQNIRTVEQAKVYAEQFNKNYYRIFRALGVANRQPTPNQIKYMDKWIDEYNFALEVIETACEKTIAAINEPSLPYVDTILSKWYNKGVKSPEAVAELDKQYKANKTKERSEKATTQNTATKNRFHNHSQRDYDYDDIEKKMKDLLKKKSSGA